MKGARAIAPRVATLTEALVVASRGELGLVFVDRDEAERRLSYRELSVRARHTAQKLAALGVRRGDRVAIIMPTSVDLVVTFFGVLFARAVPVPLYPPLRLGRLAEYHTRTAAMLERVGASLVISDGQVRRVLGRAVERARPRLGCIDFADLAVSDGAGGVDTDDPNDPNDTALIQFSSGSTVDPKPVALSHANILYNVGAIEGVFLQPNVSRGHPHSGVCWLPLYHDMGLIGCLLTAVYHPGQLVLIPPELFLSRPALWLRAISRHRATTSPAPNFAYGLCVKRIRDDELEGVDLSSWRLALNGAEPVSARVLDRFAVRFARWGFDPRALTPAYGLAEAALAVTLARPAVAARRVEVDATALARDHLAQRPDDGEAPRRTLVSVGRPVPGMEVRVVDAFGAEHPERAVGRIWIRGPSVMQGYFGDPHATTACRHAADDRGEAWLDTGDLGLVIDGELYVCGRAKDVVILRGKNHAPQEFEDALDGLLGVRSGCAVAIGFVPSGGDDEELALLAERASDADAGRDETLVLAIRARVQEQTGIWPHTVRVLAPGGLPRTSSGKLRRQAARQQFLADTLTPPRRVTTFGLLLESVRSALAFWWLRVARLGGAGPA